MEIPAPIREAAERLLHEVKLHEEVCDCPPDRPSLHHDIEIVAQAALSSAQQETAGVVVSPEYDHEVIFEGTLKIDEALRP